jgi:RimJ/RimL family protein N-acetyltransferase
MTYRLILRPLRDEDILFITSLLGNENRTKYLFGGTVMEPPQAAAFIKQHFTAEDATIGMGVLATNRQEGLVGFAGIIPTDCLGNRDFEFGFVLSQEAEGNDYATEIGYFQMQYAFETLRLSRILALAHPENSASVHVLRDKLKMTKVSQLGKTAHRGPRIVFCRSKAEGLPKIHGKGWDSNFRSADCAESVVD